MSSTHPAISVRGLAKSYTIRKPGWHATLAETLLARLKNPFQQNGRDTFWALKNISFDIEAGETFALLGPNGSGKTTTLKCMVGLTLPTSGNIAVEGFDVWRNSREAQRLMSFLPQRVSFSDQLTGREVLEFYCRLRRIPSQRIDETLNTSNFHFDGFFEKSVSQFSGGMIQRLGLAVACLPDAPVLVLDEPTVSLDPNGAIQFREFLASLKRRGKTIVFSSHMLADVEQLADRVAILVGGKLVALQSIAALRDELMRSSRMRVVLANPGGRLLGVVRACGVDDAALQGDSLVITSRAEDRLKFRDAVQSVGLRTPKSRIARRVPARSRSFCTCSSVSQALRSSGLSSSARSSVMPRAAGTSTETRGSAPVSTCSPMPPRMARAISASSSAIRIKFSAYIAIQLVPSACPSI